MDRPPDEGGLVRVLSWLDGCLKGRGMKRSLLRRARFEQCRPSLPGYLFRGDLCRRYGLMLQVLMFTKMF